MFIDLPACDSLWRLYLASLPPDHRHHSASPDSFGFGGEPDLADELAALVLDGTKRATASLPVEFTSLGEALPQAGDLSIIVRGDGTPVAIIERTHVDSRPFAEVDQAFASVEGEGDGSLDYWRRVHLKYFGRVCADHGEDFDDRTLVLCQIFRVVWPRADAVSSSGQSAGPDAA